MFVSHYRRQSAERKDVEGANAAGAKAVLLWRKSTTVPEWSQILTVRSLSELHPALGGMCAGRPPRKFKFELHHLARLRSRLPGRIAFLRGLVAQSLPRP